MRYPVLIGFCILVTCVTYAANVDRGYVEDGTDAVVLNGATDGGRTLLIGQPSIRLRPATGGTRAIPDAGIEGMSLNDIVSCRLEVCAPAPEDRLTGTGTAQAWTMNSMMGRWGEMVEKHKRITSTADCQTYPVEPNSNRPNGARLLYRLVGVGVVLADGGIGTPIVGLECCRAASAGGCGP